MNKNDLIDVVIEEHDVTKTFARDLVDTVFRSIGDAAQNGNEGLDLWLSQVPCHRARREEGSQSHTGEAIKIAASKRLKFSPARAMNAALNTKRRARKKA